MAQPDEDSLVLDDELDDGFDPDRDLEAPPEDAAEQAQPANPALTRQAPRIPFEADEADALDQSTVVPLDDDYR